MNQIGIAFVISLSLMSLAGCGDRKSTETGGGAVDVSKTEVPLTTKSGNLVTVTYDASLNPADVMKFTYSVKTETGEPLSATVHWGDNSDQRIKGEGTTHHRYVANGKYQIAIQPDKDEKVAVGEVTVTEFGSLLTDGEISDVCRITGVDVTPRSGTGEIDTVFRVIVDFEAYDIALSPMYNPPNVYATAYGETYLSSRDQFTYAFDSVSNSTFSEKRIDKGQIVFEGKLSNTNSEYGPQDNYGWGGFFPGSYLEEMGISINAKSGGGRCQTSVPLNFKFRE